MRDAYSELKEYVEENFEVENVDFDRRCEEPRDLYLKFNCSAAGIDLWGLHDEFDVDVVFSWHDPTKDKLDMGLRLV